MGYTIYLRKLTSTGSNVTISWVYEIDNFESFNMRYDNPITATPLPEENADKTILLKMMGNTATYTLNWIVRIQNSVVAKDYNSTNTRNASDILNILNFMKKDFLDARTTTAYDMIIADKSLNSNIFTKNANDPLRNINVSGTGIIFTVSGFIQSFDVVTTKESPITFNASVSLIEGEQIVVIDGSLSGAPSNLTYSVSGTTVTLNWDAPSNAGSGTLKQYIVHYRNESTGFESTVIISGSPPATTAMINAGTGTFVYWVVPKTDYGLGKSSEKITVVV